MKKGDLRNYTKFICDLFNSLEACSFIKKETRAQVFSCEYCEIFKNTYLKNGLLAPEYLETSQ